MANEFIIKNGFHSKGDSNITGSLGITGITDVSASIAAAADGGGFTPSLSTDIPARNISSSANISASGTIFANSYVGLPGGIISGSEQLPGGLVSGSSQVSYTGISNTPGGIISGSEQLPGGLISGSSQLPGGIISGSEQLPGGLVSGSSQVSYVDLSNIPGGIISGSEQLPGGLISGSEQLPGGLVSGSSQVSYTGLSNIPSGIISGSVDTASFTSQWNVTNAGSSAYNFTGNGVEASDNNPDIYLTRGEKYRFNVSNASAHPWFIKTLPGTGTGNQYNDGVTGNGTSTVVFDVQFDAPTHLYYQCQYHSVMKGNIYIADAREASGSFSGSFQGDGSGLTGVGGDSFPFTGDAEITGSLIISSSTSESLSIQGSGSTIFDIQGSQGQLFSVTDDLLDEVFSVADISGDTLLSVSGSGLVEIPVGDLSGSATATASYGAFKGDGSQLTNVPAASGKFGISNSSGEFTYYTTLTLAVAAASSGDVVQMFANVEETGAVEVAVPDGVTIDGNGYTYTLNNAGTVSALTYTSAGSTTNYLTNIRIVRKGGTNSNANSLCILIGATNVSKKLYGDGVRLESDFGTCLSQTGAGSRFDEVTGIVGAGIQGAYWAYGRLKNCDFKGTTSYGIQVRNGAEAINCKGESTDVNGIYFNSGLPTSTNCIGISDSSAGILTNADLRDCTGESVSSNGIQLSSTITITNCTGRSSSGNGIFTSSTSEIIDCTGISVSGPGIYLRNNNNGTAHNCVAYSSTSTLGALRFQDGGTITNSSIFHEGTSGGNQYGVYTSGTAKVTIIGCDITTNDPTSNAVYAASSGANTLLQDNVYKGMATALSANVIQVAVNVADIYGNTHVTSSVPYNYNFTAATAVSASVFSGSFVGDGSQLTNLPSSGGVSDATKIFVWYNTMI